MNLEFLEEGSEDCPLIRLYGTVPAEFVSLHREIRRLATGEVERVSVDRLPGFRSVDGCELTMVSSPRDIGVHRRQGTPSFEWQLTPSMWDIAGDFIDPFARDLEVGRYQWLAGRQGGSGLNVGKIAVLMSATESGEW
ncbi:MAG: hypothetical protein IT535_11765 [Bauldia sp.]|nr:hypothetical protein [Bauldia sp.]